MGSGAGDELVGIYDTFQEAALEAGERFVRGPYLIRQVAPTDWIEYAKKLWNDRYGSI